ncbi:unnamed protein product, partial [Chrysoparadoxa australica]
NGEKIPLRKFSEYAELFGAEVLAQEAVQGWDVVLTRPHDAVSMVNGVVTPRGTHVSAASSAVANHLVPILKKKGLDIKKPASLRKHFSVWVNAVVANPAFDGQRKEVLTTKVPAVELSKRFLNKATKALLDPILEDNLTKQVQKLNKTSGKKTGKVVVPKLDDANWAGTAKSEKCTLFLTEGDSAKSLAISGLSVIGRDAYGVFPLKGKLLNVRGATPQQLAKNQEICNLLKIIGLKYGEGYTSARGLRYGSVCIMADQDADGSHIKGLLVNFVHHFWPMLLQVSGFLKQFITPIVKVFAPGETKSFFTLTEYNRWKLENPGSNLRTKYFKGLGTSSSADAKVYFSDLVSHLKTFTFHEDDGELVDMAFNAKRAGDRKTWLSEAGEDLQVDYSAEATSIGDFVDKELIHFSLADNVRSIPDVVDGLKPSQRKILFGCFKRDLKEEVKVAQLAGYVSEHASYHHGEASLTGAIVGMAQNFVGSNNLNLMFPSGQFGSRLQGGKDAASPRYIFTRLEEVTRKLFPAEDFPVLRYRDDDGFRVEPYRYCPIVPMVLVNGAEGIGTGWSTRVPSFSPEDVIENCKRMIAKAELLTMTPWYRGFKGGVTVDDDKVTFHGTWTVDGNDVTVTELPIRTWTDGYKEHLEQLVEKGKLKKMVNLSTEADVKFVVTCLGQPDLSLLKLTSTMSMSNMHLMNGTMVKKYSVADIFEKHYQERLALYAARKEYQVAQAEQELQAFQNKLKFVQLVVSGDLVLTNRKKKDLEADLSSRGIGPSVLDMKLWSVTSEKVEELEEEVRKKKALLEDLVNTSENDTWLSELNDLQSFVTE